MSEELKAAAERLSYPAGDTRKFAADTPAQSGWYFASDNSDNQTGDMLGWFDAERKRFTSFNVEIPAMLDQSPWVFAFTFAAPGRWDDDCGGMWRGPELWYGPVSPQWQIGAGA